jgi:hypothetical protein
VIAWSENELNLMLGVSSHTYLPAPLGVPPAICAHLEGFGITILGYSFLFRKISNDVFFDNYGAVQVLHDIGFMIPQYNIVPPAPPNLYLAVSIPFSSAKVVFFKPSVVVNNVCAGSYFDGLENLLLCGEPIKLPGGFLIDVHLRNTVVWEFRFIDWCRGLIVMLWEILSSYLLGKLAGKAGGEWLKGLVDSNLIKIAPDFVKKAFSTLFQKIPAKLLTSPVGGFLTEPSPEVRDGSGPPTSFSGAPNAMGPQGTPPPVAPGDARSPTAAIADSAPLINP